MAQTVSMPCESEFEVYFRSLLRRGLELIFPCDREGHVDLDALSDSAKTNYLFARAMVGREYARPAIRPREASKNPTPTREPPARLRGAAWWRTHVMIWTSPRTQPASVSTRWQADEIVVARGDEVIDRLRADDIARVLLVHAGEGESPAEVRAALFEMVDRTVVLGAASGIAGRVLFERQAYWSQRNCIYWVGELGVAWTAVLGHHRWPLAHPRLPQHRTLTRAAAASLLEHAQLTGPHTWDERKRHRIERRRPFPGRAVGDAPAHSGMLT